MRYIAFTVLFLAFCYSAFGSESSVSVIETQQKARFGKITNYIIVTSESSYSANIPEFIQVGRNIPISYKKNGVLITEKFPVACIEYRDSDNLCWVRTTCRREISDILYVHNCKVISK